MNFALAATVWSFVPLPELACAGSLNGTDDVLDQRTAAKRLESIAHLLQQLDAEGKSELVTFVMREA
jgi:hypothetical protein